MVGGGGLQYVFRDVSDSGLPDFFMTGSRFPSEGVI